MKQNTGLLILISLIHQEMSVHVGQEHQINISFYLPLYFFLRDGPSLTGEKIRQGESDKIPTLHQQLNVHPNP